MNDGPPIEPTPSLSEQDDHSTDSDNIKDDHTDARPVWSNRLSYATALLSLLLASFWRGAGIIGGPLPGGSGPVWIPMAAMVLCLLVIGWPLFLLEVGTGQRYTVGGMGIWQLPPYCRSRIGGSRRRCRHRRPWTGLGVAGMMVGCAVAAYSVGILAWTTHALLWGEWSGLLNGTVRAGSAATPWKNSDNLGESLWNTNHTKPHNSGVEIATARTGILVDASSNHGQEEFVYGLYHTPMQLQVAFRDYFVETIVGQSLDFGQETDPNIHLVGPNVFFAGLIWLWTFIASTIPTCSRGGRLPWMGRINLLWTSLSLILLTVLCVGSWLIPAPPSGMRYQTEDESSSNVKGGVDDTDTTNRSTTDSDYASGAEVDILSSSMIHSLYITGILTGILSSYGSSAPSLKEPSAKIAALVMMVNVVVLCFTGYAISCALDSVYASVDKESSLTAFYTSQEGNSVPLDALSTTLLVVLVQWPAALATMSQGIVWIRLVYAVVLLLGLQFPTATVTALVTVIRDDRTSRLPRWQITGVACSLGFATSLLFVTNAGLIVLDTIDYYLSLGLLLLAFLESFAAGWVYDLDDQIRSFGIKPIVSHMLWNFAPVVTSATIWFGHDAGDPQNEHRMWLGLFGGVVTFLLFFAFTFLFIRGSYEDYLTRAYEQNPSEPVLDARTYYMDFCFGNTEALKRALEPAIGPLPQLWHIFMKRVIPHLLLLVFIKRFLLPSSGSSASLAFGSFGGYPMQPFQWTGILVFAVILGLFLLGVVAPDVYSGLAPPPTSVFMNRRDTWEDVEETVEESSAESTTVDEPRIEELDHMEEPIDMEDIDDDDDDDSVNVLSLDATDSIEGSVENSRSINRTGLVLATDRHDVNA